MMDALSRLTAALADRYRIERELGAGGMATVYLAEDIKHDRKVAIKVLKPELAAVLGAERFVQEIKTTAALSHPHILPLFDSGEADGFLYYVMPYIEGETIRDRLNRETQLSVDESVRITREIADALDYAHRHGVIHRDIKPENLLLHDGRAMVMDFGIALAVSAAAGGRMTETGLSLGTPHYMSPEQATADKTITGRSDIYSLASVCYEMLTGEPPHTGSSAQAIIMKIIAEPVTSVTALRKAVPPHVAAALGMALQKLPADRFGSAKEFSEALANPAFTTAAAGGVTGGAMPPLRDRRLLVTAGIAVLAIVVAVAGWFRPEPEAPVHRYHFVTPDSGLIPGVFLLAAAAPDGSFYVYHGPSSDSRVSSSLWMRRREEILGAPIRGTAGATTFAISPDGQEVAFLVTGALKVVPVSGGAARTLVESGAIPAGVAWLDDGTLVVAVGSSAGGAIDLATISAQGGELRTLGLNGPTHVAALPSPIIGRRAFFYARCTTPTSCDLRAFDLDDSTDVALVSGVRFATHTPLGYFVFAQGPSLMAQRFDAASMSAIGTALEIVDDVSSDVQGPTFTLSRNGTFIYRPGAGRTLGTPYDMVWLDRKGQMTIVDSAWQSFRLTEGALNHGWALSPDGRQLAIGLTTESGDDIWIKQMPNGALTKLTSGGLSYFRPRWMPDGRSVYYLSNLGMGNVAARRADGVGPERPLGGALASEALVSPDSQWLLVRVPGSGPDGSSRDIAGRRLSDSDTSFVPILAEGFDEMSVMLSPDGRWLLYVSTETGRNEVYLRPFPDWNRLRLAVSVGGGEAPLWSRDGREIFYLSADKRMMAVRFSAAASPTIGAPTALFAVPNELLSVETAYYTPWDIARDGRFLMARRTGVTAGASYPVVVDNFFALLSQGMKR